MQITTREGDDCPSVGEIGWSPSVTPCATAGEVNATKATVNGINLIASQRPFSGKVRSIRRRGGGFAFGYSSLEHRPRIRLTIRQRTRVLEKWRVALRGHWGSLSTTVPPEADAYRWRQIGSAAQNRGGALMSAEIIEFGHPKATSANGKPRVRSPSRKSIRPNTGKGGTPAGNPIFAAIKHRIAVQAIDDWPGDPPTNL
jgi:hypothetical protein